MEASISGTLIASCLGLFIGSFVATLSYRIPRGFSLLRPPSHCPDCGVRLSWIELIPLFSYLIQGGRCIHCRGRIPLRYPVIEVGNLTLYIILYIRMGLNFIFITHALFGSLLLAVAAVDMELGLIPNSLLLSCFAITVGKEALELLVFKKGITVLYYYLMGGIVGISLPLAAVLIMRLFTRREVLGGGDLKLLAVSGLFLGAQRILIAVIASSGIGVAIGLLLIFMGKVQRDFPFPFAPLFLLGYLASVVL